ncbi:MAG: DUF3857 domain-containing protein [Acidobacteriaceae bacterium]|nr:DUF3857 domain-containing protein [Acidobacteriaceae bacterium]
MSTLGPRTLVPALLFAAAATPLWSQTPPALDKYAAEPLVVEKAADVIVIKADGTGTRQQTIAIKIQTDAALRSLGVLNVGFASASEHVTFQYVRAHHKDGTITETPPSSVIEQPTAVTREAPFYSDQKEAQLPIKDLRVGDTLEWQYTVIRTRAEAPNQSWGAENLRESSAITLNESVELHAPKTLALTVWTNPTLNLKPKETTVGDEKVWLWEAQQLKPTAGPEAEAEAKAKKGKLLTEDEIKDNEQGKLPGIAWTTFHSWDEVGIWYRSLAAKRAVPDDEIRAKATELTTGLKTDDEKIRAIYGYVSTQIRYIGVAFGVGRFQPHEAADVLHNQYGDCKDKQTLLSALLSAVGIQSDAALIGAGIRFNDPVPSPASFNHLIGRVMLNGKPLWLDPTEEVAPPGMMYSALRDKEALVIPPSGPAKIVKTVADMPFTGEDTWTAVGKLNANGISESHIVTTWRGDEELVFRSALKSIPPSQYNEVSQRFAGSFGYGGTTSHAEFSRPDDTSKPLSIAFDYHREKGGDWPNLRIIPQMGPSGISTVNEKEPPVAPIDLGTTKTLHSHSEMTLPEGWTATLPEAIHERSRWATYDLTYSMDKGTLITDRKVVILERKVPASEWQTYNKFANAVSENYVLLHRKGMESTRKTPIDPQKEQRLQELRTEADAAWKAKDRDLLERIVKKMKAIDPDGDRVHAWQASVYEGKGKYKDAFDEDQKELDLYPDETDRYKSLVWIAERMRDKALTLDTLKKWNQADPSSTEAAMGLSSALLSNDEPTAAITVLEAAVKNTTDGSDENEQLRTQLGSAQLKAGQKKVGETTLAAIINTTQDAGLLNNAAYALSEADIALPLAEDASKRSVSKLSDASVGWTLDEDFSALRGKTNLEIAAWDTLAWIYYREKKLPEAYAWLAPAARNRSDKTITDHFAQVKEAMLAAKLTVPADPTEGKSSQQKRSLDLDGFTAPKGVYEYHLLVGKGHVERAKAVANDPPGASDAIKRLDLTSFFPAQSDAKLAFAGFVNCVSNKCTVVLVP